MDERQRSTVASRALAAYFRSGGRDQPSGHPTTEAVDGKEYVVLRNVRGILAVYRVRTSGALKRLVRWPRDLESR